jgi:hypothetical protein
MKNTLENHRLKDQMKLVFQCDWKSLTRLMVDDSEPGLVWDLSILLPLSAPIRLKQSIIV